MEGEVTALFAFGFPEAKVRSFHGLSERAGQIISIKVVVPPTSGLLAVSSCPCESAHERQVNVNVRVL